MSDVQFIVRETSADGVTIEFESEPLTKEESLKTLEEAYAYANLGSVVRLIALAEEELVVFEALMDVPEEPEDSES